MIKELNSSGKGYISDIISGLEHVITKIQSKHIITLLLSIATIEIPSSLENPFKQLIDEIIKKVVWLFLQLEISEYQIN